MRQFFKPIIFMLLIGSPALGADLRFPIDTINQVLNHIGIDTSDVSFRTDWVDRDSFRLNLIDSMTIHPLIIPKYLKARADFLLDTTISPDLKFDSLTMALKSEFSSTPVHSGDFTSQEGVSLWNRIQSWHPSGKVAGEFAQKIKEILMPMYNAQAAHYLDAVSASEYHFLADTFMVFLKEEEKNAIRTEYELDNIQKFQDKVAERFKSIGPKLSFPSLLRQSRGFTGLYQTLADWLLAHKNQLNEITDKELMSDFGNLDFSPLRIKIGGRGNDVYEGSYDLIIDFGGDDEYLLSGGSGNQIIVDLGGNDRYIAQSDFCFGSGHFGCGILDDWSGNDIYIAKNYSLGCGIFGTGILIDRAGDDIYQGDICCEAASSFGVGMLLDYSGMDSYNARLYSQGFAFIMGASALVDNKGNDTYTAGWKYGDILRYEDHYLSMSQGFGFGYRPYFSGGVGLLVDGGGNDNYSADIFGQGGSYWFALGGLIDYGGNDRYNAYQYAQGAATHLTLAALMDLAGDDTYSSKGVSQGCGHDLAYGLLLDCAGNDQYDCYDLSQAAGSANGIGMLLDLQGNDGYFAREKSNTHGYGNPRREFGSIGLFLDLGGGKDDYRGYGSDNRYWVSPSKWGIGADLDTLKRDTVKPNEKK